MWYRSIQALAFCATAQFGLSVGGSLVLAQSTAASRAPGQEAQPTPSGAVPTRLVLELFTSQGCSSCPAADRVLEQFTQQSGVLALSFAVDYWDYLGWKDTLASPKFTLRQKYYAKKRGDGQVYTPQVIVNGLAHSNGADKGSIERAALDTEMERAARWVPIDIARDGEHLVIKAGVVANPNSAEKDATLWLVTFAKRVDVAVKRGENAGKTLSYLNVVRDVTAVGMWNGEPMTVKLDRKAITQSDGESCAVVLQVGKVGPIIGAAFIPSL